MKINFFDFAIDKFIVAPIIYGNCHHSTTNRGVVVHDEIKKELARFLSDFNVWIGVEQTPYYRIDAYFNEQGLWILEVNASFVDGWGTALNLSRASKIRIDYNRLVFPKLFTSMDKLYLPELELFVSELACLGFHDHSVCEWDGRIDQIYVYGRVGLKEPHILPYDGIRLDNKLNLGLFSREWKSDVVKIPFHYISRFNSWEEIPQEVALKFCDKGSVECKRARQSVMLNKPLGKARFIKQCYEAETLLAQNIVCPTRDEDGNNCQLVILAIGDRPITGYAQYSRREIINDNSIHGPLSIG